VRRCGTGLQLLCKSHAPCREVSGAPYMQGIGMTEHFAWPVTSLPLSPITNQIWGTSGRKSSRMNVCPAGLQLRSRNQKRDISLLPFRALASLGLSYTVRASLLIPEIGAIQRWLGGLAHVELIGFQITLIPKVSTLFYGNSLAASRWVARLFIITPSSPHPQHNSYALATVARSFPQSRTLYYPATD